MAEALNPEAEAPFVSSRPQPHEGNIDPKTDALASSAPSIDTLVPEKKAEIEAIGLGGEKVYGGKFYADRAAEARASAENATPEEAASYKTSVEGLKDSYERQATRDQASAELEQDRAGFFYDNGVDVTTIADPNNFGGDPKLIALNEKFLEQRNQAAARLAEKTKAA